MLKIGKTYLTQENGSTRLCADLTISSRRTTLWFGVNNIHSCFLTSERADAFVMALLPYAMRSRHEIVCEDPISARLHYQLTSALIPALSSAGERYHSIGITGPLAEERIPNQGAVGTGFSGGVDSLYTIMRHTADSELPLTHIAVFTTGNIEDREVLSRLYHQAKIFGMEQNLEAIFVETNFHDVLPEFYSSVYTFRNLACVLALQRLFNVYLLSSGPELSKMKLDVMRCSRYDLLTINCASTESLSFYLSGMETNRVGKLAALTHWKPSRQWIHSCTSIVGENHNCGRCKKCIRDMTVLYALGQLEQYQAVYDIDDYLRHLPERIGFVLASRHRSNTGAQVVQLLEEKNIPVPSRTYAYEKQFRLAMQNLELQKQSISRRK